MELDNWQKVKELLNFGNMKIISPVLGIYKFSRKLKLDWFLKSLLLPKQYKLQVKNLDISV